jgi:hypothetical protein
MAERTFEMELERRFADAPVLPDAELFAARVTERLDRGWAFRRFLIGGLGISGGLIGGGQVLGSGLVGRLDSLSAQSSALLRTGFGEAPLFRSVSTLLAATTSLDGQVLWMSAALAVLAVGLFVTRAIREI